MALIDRPTYEDSTRCSQGVTESVRASSCTRQLKVRDGCGRWRRSTVSVSGVDMRTQRGTLVQVNARRE